MTRDRNSTTFDDVVITGGDPNVVQESGQTLTPSLLTIPTTFFPPVVSGGTAGFFLQPSLLSLTLTFQAPTITGGGGGGPGGTPAWLYTSVNYEYFGVNLLVSGMSASGVLTVTRVTPENRITVRGMDHVAVTTANYGVVDTEMPIDTEFHYELRWVDVGGTFIERFPANSSSDFVMSELTGHSFVLRDLFRPSPLVDWCLGVVPSEDINIRGGVFSVIGRPDPVVVVDVKESTTSTLNVITRDRSATRAVQAVLNEANPLLLQIPDEYLIGTEGVLYLQPTKTTVRRPIADGRRPERVFEVAYTQVSAPPASVIFSVAGTTYRTVASTYLNYRDMLFDEDDVPRTYFEIAYGATFGYT